MNYLYPHGVAIQQRLKISKHKVFISYDCADSDYKNCLIKLNCLYNIFVDHSYHVSEMPSHTKNKTILHEIWENGLKKASVTLLLVGKDTRKRKYVDWEIHLSMIDEGIYKRCGILVVNLPTIYGNSLNFLAHGEREKSTLYPHVTEWEEVNSRKECERVFPFMPERILDNLARPSVTISVIPWHFIIRNVEKLPMILELTFRNRKNCNYDTSRPRRKNNT